MTQASREASQRPAAGARNEAARRRGIPAAHGSGFRKQTARHGACRPSASAWCWSGQAWQPGGPVGAAAALAFPRPPPAEPAAERAAGGEAPAVDPVFARRLRILHGLGRIPPRTGRLNTVILLGPGQSTPAFRGINCHRQCRLRVSRSAADGGGFHLVGSNSREKSAHGRGRTIPSRIARARCCILPPTRKPASCGDPDSQRRFRIRGASLPGPRHGLGIQPASSTHLAPGIRARILLAYVPEPAMPSRSPRA